MSEITQKQLEANRENAKLGGVKTEEGKTISRYNSIKHGLLSKEVLIKGEDEDALVELGKRLREEFKPGTEIELLLVDRITSNFWRLRRIMTKENASVFNDYSGTIDRDADVFFRYESMLERGIYKALHELQRLQAIRNGEKVPSPIALDIDVSVEKESGFVS